MSDRTSKHIHAQIYTHNTRKPECYEYIFFYDPSTDSKSGTHFSGLRTIPLSKPEYNGRVERTNRTIQEDFYNGVSTNQSDKGRVSLKSFEFIHHQSLGSNTYALPRPQHCNANETAFHHRQLRRGLLGRAEGAVRFHQNPKGLFQSRPTPCLGLRRHPRSARAEQGWFQCGNPPIRAPWVTRDLMQHFEMAQHGDTKPGGGLPLGRHPMQQGGQAIHLCLGHGMDQIIQCRLHRHGRDLFYLFHRHGTFLPQRIKRKFFDKLPEITGVQRACQGTDHRLRFPFQRPNPCAGAGGGDVLPRWGIIVNGGDSGCRVGLKLFAQF